jgi:hypothetical protein
MSFLQNLLGNSTQASPSDYQPLIENILVENESVFTAFKTFRDFIIFTNERLILVDAQGLTGRKKSFKSIPYSQISVFTKENAGTFDMDSEINLFVRSYPLPIQLKFGKDSNIDAVYQIISDYVLKVT